MSLACSLTPHTAALLLLTAKLRVHMRHAGDVAGHEFHGNQYTAGGLPNDRAVSRAIDEAAMGAKINTSGAKVEAVLLSSLHPSEPASMTPVDGLKEKYQKQWPVPPPVVNKHGVILDGHHRVASAIAAGHTKIFVVRVRGNDEKPRALGDVTGHEFHGNQWTQGSGEHETLRLYTQSGGTYREVNDGLRGDKDMSSHETVALLDKTFKEQSEPAPPVVYRGMAGYEPEEIGLVEGATFTDKGFVSTAAVKADAMKFATHGEMKLSGEAVGIIFKINTGKVPSLNMSRYSRYGESEHLLNRGTTFRVTKVVEGYPGEKLSVVHMSVVK